MRKILILLVWPLASLMTLISCCFFLYITTQVQEGQTFLKTEARALVPLNQYEFYAAMPQILGSFETAIEKGDARSEILYKFLSRYNSPLIAHADKFIEAADKYNLDFRLLAAIAMQESNLCRNAPEDSYNCWGFGIYGNKVTKFPSYEEAIEKISKTLKEKYINQGLDTPELIMTKYTPSSNGSWAFAVSKFMKEME